MAGMHAMQRMLLEGAPPAAEAAGEDVMISCADCTDLNHPAVVASDWIGFLALLGASIVLIWKLTTFKGPDGEDKYYMGYRENKMISVFVNLFAAVSYWARLASHANGNVGPASDVVNYKYLDYLLTCPLLTADLLWSLNLPYKFTYAGFVAICIVCAFCATMFPAPAKFMWFGFGLALFLYTWYNILMLVRMRLDQMVAKKVKRVAFYLKMACSTYFAIWIGYPTLWVLFEARVIDPISSHLLHVLFDVLAKSVYGFALLYFVLAGDKNDWVFLQLRPTVEKTDNDDEEDEKEGEPVIIGSKKAKQHRASKIIYRDSTESDGADFPKYSDFGSYAPPSTHGEINSTEVEIMQLNRQLETLMAKEQATRRDVV